MSSHTAGLLLLWIFAWMLCETPASARTVRMPMVRFVSTEAEGPLEPVGIARRVRTRLGEIKTCYRTLLANVPDFSTELTIRFEVQQGTSGARTIEASPSHPQFERCVDRALGDLLFEVHEQPTKVVLAICFRPS